MMIVFIFIRLVFEGDGLLAKRSKNKHSHIIDWDSVMSLGNTTGSASSPSTMTLSDVNSINAAGKNNAFQYQSPKYTPDVTSFSGGEEKKSSKLKKTLEILGGSTLVLGTLGLLSARIMPTLSITLLNKSKQSGREALSSKMKGEKPAWLSDLKTPISNRTEKVVEETKAGETKKFTAYFKMVQKHLNQSWESRFGGHEYLPEVHQKALKQLWRSPKYWFNRLFSPDKALLQEVRAAGPLAIKKIQQEDYESKIAGLKAFREDMKKEQSFHKRMMGKFLDFFIFKGQERQYKLFNTLKNNVAPEPISIYKEEIDKLTRDAAGKGIQLTNIENFRAGSIGQVCIAKDQTGNQYAIKLIKKELKDEINKDSNYLDGTKRYLAYQGMVSHGTSEESLDKIIRHSESSAELLREETKMPLEIANTKAMHEWLQNNPNLKDVIKTPEIIAESENGAVMSFVGKKDLAELTPEERKAWYEENRDTMIPAMLEMTRKSPIIGLDMHSGNFRTGEKGELYMLDLARVAKFKPGASEQVNKLTDSFYLALAKQGLEHPAGNNAAKKALKDDDFLKELKGLLALNPTGNAHYLDQLNKIKPEPPALKDEAAETELNGLVNRIFFGSTEENPFHNPSIIHTWGHAAEALPGTITESPLSKEDFLAAQKKMKQFTNDLLPSVDSKNSFTNGKPDKIKQLPADSKAHEALMQQMAPEPLSDTTRKSLDALVRKCLEKDLTN